MNNKQQPEATNKIQSAPNYLSDNYHSERAVWRGVNDSIQSFQGFLLKNR